MLEDYSHYHFSEEEKILKEKNSPDISLQKKQHQFFKSEIIRIKKEIMEGRSVSPESLLSFSKTWLTEHILNVDKKIGDLK
jgi:hemerythrin-like metal-binding protein